MLTTDRRTWWGVVLVTWVVFLLTAHWRSGQVNDTQAAIWPAYQFVHHGTFFLDHVRGLPHNLWFAPDHGHVVSHRAMGVVLAGVPVCALLSWTSLTPEQLNALNGSLMAALAVAFLFLVFRSIATRRTAVAAAGVIAFGTSMWTVAGAETWPQTMDALFLALTLLAVSRGRFWWAGLAITPALVTRPHVSLVAFVIGLGLAIHRRSLRPAVAIGVPAAMAIVVLRIWNAWMFGAASIGGAYAADMNRATSAPGTRKEIVAYLGNAAAAGFTPGVGLFVFTPVALLAVYWICRHGRTGTHAWAKAAFGGGVAYQLMQLRLNGYSGGGAFYGNRLVIELVVLSSPLALASYLRWSEARPWRQFVAAVVSAYGVCTFAVGALLSYYLVGTGRAGDDWTHYYPVVVVRAAGVNGLLVAVPAVAVLVVLTLHRYRVAASRDRGPEPRCGTRSGVEPALVTG